MHLKDMINQIRQEKDILLMTHLVLGYPSFDVNRQVIEQMVNNGVDLIELQIPFSEPVADGPVILKANQDALAEGITVEECWEFAEEMISTHDIPFLFMTYFNIIYKYGEEAFFRRAADIGIKGFIIPDLPPEETNTFFKLADQYSIAPIMIYAPTSTATRMKQLSNVADGFIYCVARRGVTGAKTSFDEDISGYLAQCRESTDLPLAVGFGIGEREDIEFLKGKADIAVIGSKTIKLIEEKGPQAVGPFIANIR